MMPAASRGQEAAPSAVWCDLQAGEWLARRIAEQFGLECSLVRAALGNLPPNKASLKDSPRGWTMIGDWAASTLTEGQRRETALLPTIH